MPVENKNVILPEKHSLSHKNQDRNYEVTKKKVGDNQVHIEDKSNKCQDKGHKTGDKSHKTEEKSEKIKSVKIDKKTEKPLKEGKKHLKDEDEKKGKNLSHSDDSDEWADTKRHGRQTQRKQQIKGYGTKKGEQIIWIKKQPATTNESLMNITAKTVTQTSPNLSQSKLEEPKGLVESIKKLEKNAKVNEKADDFISSGKFDKDQINKGLISDKVPPIQESNELHTPEQKNQKKRNEEVTSSNKEKSSLETTLFAIDFKGKFHGLDDIIPQSKKIDDISSLLKKDISENSEVIDSESLKLLPLQECFPPVQKLNRVNMNNKIQVSQDDKELIEDHKANEPKNGNIILLKN